MRVALARLLLQRPTLLLLDEPTNHLDLESLGWLESYLDAYDGSVIVVSHDRYFLNRMVTAIAELSPAGLEVYPGDYDDYLAQREARQALLEARAKNQAKRVAEIERFIERFRYKATKARQVQSRIKMLERLERVEVGGAAREIRFSFPAPPRTGRHVAQLRRHRQGLRPEGRLLGHRPRHRARGPHRARRAERRGQIDAPPDARGRAAARRRGADPGRARHAALLRPAPARRARPDAHGARGDGSRVARDRPQRGCGRCSARSSSRATPSTSGSGCSRAARRRGSRSRGCSCGPRRSCCLDEPTNHLDLASPRRSSRTRSPTSRGRSSSSPTIGTSSTAWRRRSSRSATAGSSSTSAATTTTRPRSSAAGRAPPLGPSSRPRRPPRPPPAARAPPASAVASSAPADPGRPRRRARVDPAVRELRRRLDALEAEIHAIEARLEDLGRALADPTLYADGERARAVTLERQQAEEHVAWLLHEWEALSESLAAHE